MPPLWPYQAVGRSLRGLALPFDLLYRYAVTRTYIIGREHLNNLPPRVIFAGTHHGFADELAEGLRAESILARAVHRPLQLSLL